MKKFVYLIVAAALAVASLATQAQTLSSTVDRNYMSQEYMVPILSAGGYQQITSLSASTALTVPSTARYALMRCTAQSVRYRFDGSTTAPTTTVGNLLLVADPPVLIPQSALATTRIIETAATAVCNVQYYSR